MTIKKFSNLEGKKIKFKSLNISDVKHIHDYASDKEVSIFIGWPLMKDLNDTKSYIKKMLNNEENETHLYASIILKGSKIVIGTIILFNFEKEANNAEIGYVLNKNYWGKGYVTEAVSLATKYGFEILKLHKIYAKVVDANISSSKVLVKNNYIIEGSFKDHYFIDGLYYNGLVYSKFNKDV